MFSFRPWEAALDRWSTLDFKKSFNGTVSPVEMPKWVPEDDVRRLKAYGLLESYIRNKSRVWINSVFHSAEEADASGDRREYGDAALLVKTTRASLLGEEWTLVTKGAQGEVDSVDEEAAKTQHLFIQQWADKEKFSIKLMESEEQSIKFGDSVYVLGYDEDAERVRLNVYDPGFYFPQFDDRAVGAEDFPHEVWIAWEFEEDDDAGNTKVRVRRMVWYLDEDGECWYEDGVWDLGEAVGTNGLRFRGDPVDWVTEPVSLGIDFIPVVHVPNTPTTQEHFGESILSDVLQALDDIQSVDTDLQAAAATTGSPPIAVDGHGDNDQTSYGPGTLLRTGEGRATLIDTSRSLDALLKLKDSMLERLATNSRVPESLIGRVKPNEVPSGIALTLSFTPHAGLIREMRMVRDYKYRLLFNFVVRLSRVNEVEDAPGKMNDEVFETKLRFGSFLPADAQEAMTVVTQLLEAKAISRETAVLYLIDHGYPIENVVEELDRIASRDVEFAQAVAALTGNPEYAAGFLGVPKNQVLGFEDDDEDGEDDEPVPVPGDAGE